MVNKKLKHNQVHYKMDKLQNFNFKRLLKYNLHYLLLLQLVCFLL